MKRSVLIIIDGWGERSDTFGNAILHAQTPCMDALKKRWPYTTLQAHGTAVGLPAGQMGNSEVGHLTIGAGRVIRQDLSLQQHAIESGVFFKNEVLIGAIERAIAQDSRLHILGQVSPGGVHSHQDSAVAVSKLAHDLGLKDVFVHAFLDGRDTPPKSADTHIAKLESDLQKTGNGRIASVVGRYYAMDRDNRWDRTEQAYHLLTGDDHPVHSSAVDYIRSRYEDNETDEFVLPMSIADSSNKRVRLEDNDVVIFFNFRPDRSRQLTRALVDADFEDFQRKRVVKNLHVTTFTEYDPSLGLPVAFPKEHVRKTLAEVISINNREQFHVAETEKYAHVTYFLNGGQEKPFAGESRRLIPSKKVSTYDEFPAMSAPEITEAVVERINSRARDALIVVNFANPDMVGHTGDFVATVHAVEVVDQCIEQITKAALKKDIPVFITADHGNAEIEIDPNDNTPVTAHSTSPVPFIVCGTDAKTLKDGGSLQDVAPTILDVLRLPIPQEMTGHSLLSAHNKLK